MKEIKERVYSRYLQKKGVARQLTAWQELLKQLVSTEGKPEALEGTLVLDLSYANFSGTIAASFLAEAGAEVIKVEPPEGDPARVMTPFGVEVEGVGIPYLMECRNKRHITLDFAEERGRANLKRLVASADILIETFAPGEMDAWGIGYRQLREINPRLVYIAITPYGHYTRKAQEAAKVPWTDLTSQSESGLTALIGDLPGEPEPFSWPTRAGFLAAGYTSAVAAACGGLVAGFFARRTGEGQMVDIAAADAYASCVGFPPTIGYIWKKPRYRYGTLDYGLCPYGFFKCRDGYVAIACFRDQDFRAAIKILGLWRIEEDWRTLLDRITDDIEKVKELNSLVEEAVSKFTYQEIAEKFARYAVKAARSKWRGGGLPVTTKMITPREVLDQEHWKVRETFARFGVVVLPVTGKLSRTPLRVKWLSTQIGQDNDYIYEKYHLER
ncbi:MAG TPA: CoA transferase [Syntrophales bacterium]|nr:CoA transferase [Syntrophales bacterium]HOL60088.1 CoA transferase [Syntrophales bacterium]HPO35356.1 CoA transferase [Syntrophales bacterium]